MATGPSYASNFLSSYLAAGSWELYGTVACSNLLKRCNPYHIPWMFTTPFNKSSASFLDWAVAIFGCSSRPPIATWLTSSVKAAQGQANHGCSAYENILETVVENGNVETNTNICLGVMKTKDLAIFNDDCKWLHWCALSVPGTETKAIQGYLAMNNHLLPSTWWFLRGPSMSLPTMYSLFFLNVSFLSCWDALVSLTTRICFYSYSKLFRGMFD